MYIVHTTSAFVLRARSTREDSKILTFYTRELGMVEAFAQGVRKLKSKLRPHLVELSLAQVSLVRGREFWRLTSAENLMTFSGSAEKLRLVSRLFSLFSKLVSGELAHPELFDELERAFSFLSRETFDKKSLHHFEIIVVLKILYQLGYLSKEAGLEPFVSSRQWSRELIGSIEPFSRQALASINQSFEQSQL